MAFSRPEYWSGVPLPSPRENYKQLYANERANLEEMDKLLERYNFLRLMQEEIENMKRLKSPSTEIETDKKS